ncbi:MAG: oxidoreductase [Chitinophagales bacterium]|nr:oxidoreductase [Chitinophagales bacterium]HAE14020.1 oxidoreductase [Bacteroidota bacterium]MCB9019628.1 oxidoreductase [Chitinophagales bacterium]MCB9021148.1 oxidoreductase [Chitinophagales bacterium]HPE96523.1 FAD-binding oxidoreductase [Chitinophagales bacterium]
MALLPWQTAVITRVTQETANTRRFFFEIKDSGPFVFRPGQFVTLDLPIHDKQSKRMRSYSVASWPDGSNTFELVIVLMEGGAGTTYLFKEGKPGMEIPFRGPLGHFCLPDTLERDICMICTGTGIAPFRSQVQYIRHAQVPCRDIHIIFGTRKIGDILYRSELEQLSRDMPCLHYHVALSRETPESWNGHIGYVHDIYEKVCENGQKDMDFYLCGWKNMVDEARNRLKDMGYDKERIHLELYG